MRRSKRVTTRSKKLVGNQESGDKNPYGSLVDMAGDLAGSDTGTSDHPNSPAQSSDDTISVSIPPIQLDESSTKNLQDQLKEIITADSFVEKLVGLIADAILERVTQNVYKAVDHQQEAHKQKVTDLQKKVTYLEGDLARVKDDLDDHEQYSRRNSLHLYGIKEKKDKNTDTIVVELIKSKLDVDVTEKDLDRSHRVTPKNPSNGPRPIIVKFARHNVRQKVYAVRTKLKGSQIFIREDLTVKKQKLMRETLKHESIAKAWSTDGRIRALTKENKVVNITKLTDLDHI